LFDHHLHPNKERLITLLTKEAEQKAKNSSTLLSKEEKEELEYL